MKPNAIDSVALETRLSAYFVAVGATFAVAQPAEATIIYHEGPWTGSGTNTTLVSFNLAGDVATDGSNVGGEQFSIGHQEQSYNFQPGGGTKKNPKSPLPFPIPGFLASLFVQGQGDAGALPSLGGTGDFPGGAVPAGNIPPTYYYPGVAEFRLFVSQGGLLAQIQSPYYYGTYTTGPLVPFVDRAALAAQFTPNLPPDFPPLPPTLKKPGAGGTLGGPFASGEPGFLGLIFDAGDDLFPGWAEIRVDDIDSITLLGYAYEDTGMPIRIGDTGNGEPGPGPAPAPEPSTLALFALGATGLAALRRRRLIRSADAPGQDRA